MTGKRILIVEDDEVVRQFTRTVLDAEGYEVMTASSVEAAREIMSKQFDVESLCLIIDIVLSQESGIEFAQELIQRHARMRVLLISGFTDDVLMTEPEDVARIAFLGKPFVRDDLVAALDRLCR